LSSPREESEYADGVFLKVRVCCENPAGTK
jgi:hypothetical protein